MGLQRRVDDSDARQRPKLTLAGRLDGTFDGRPLSIEGREQSLVVHLSSVADAAALIKWHANVQTLMAIIEQQKLVHVLVKLPKLPAVGLSAVSKLLSRFPGV